MVKKALRVIDPILKFLVKVFSKTGNPFLIKLLNFCSKLKKEFKVYESMNWFIRIGKSRVKILGIENLPKHGAFILALNHKGDWHLAFIIAALHARLKRPIYTLVGEKVYYKNVKLADQWLAFIPRGDYCLLPMKRKLKQGKIVAIAVTPSFERREGFGYKDVTIEQIESEVKQGIGFLSRFAPVVPLGFSGPHSNRILMRIFVDPLRFLFLQKIKIQIGPVIDFSQTGRVGKDEQISHAISIIKTVFDLAGQSRYI